MKRKLVIGSIFCAAALLLVSVVSVVGYQSAQTKDQEIESPLFIVRTSNAVQKPTQNGLASYLGKGTRNTLFPTTVPQQDAIVQLSLQLLRTHPGLVIKLLANLEKYPSLTEMLVSKGITTAEMQQYLRLIQNNPSLVTEEILGQFSNALQINPPQPLGLSTSNPLGCFIVAVFALIPVTVVLTLLLLVFTLRVLTCMNINDCANNLAQSIWDQLIQGLTQEEITG